MPAHIAAHLAEERHHYGVFRLRPGYSLGAYAAAIHLLWAASEAEEWIDGDEYIPWRYPSWLRCITLRVFHLRQ